MHGAADLAEGLEIRLQHGIAEVKWKVPDE
jgi:hypothetical protein